MEITGRVIQVLPEQSGTSRAGNAWKKNEYVIETFDAYPKKVALTVFGSKTENVHMEAGKVYTVSVDIESREYNGRWYTNVNCYAAREAEDPVSGPQTPVAGPEVQGAPSPFPQPPVNKDPFGGAAAGGAFDNEASDDLPF